MNININEKLKALIPPLAEDERKQLENNIIADGCRDPLVVWKSEKGDILVDGHNRHEICERNSIKYDVTHKHFDSEVDVRIWMRKNQMGRRNLTKAWSVDLQLENAKDRLLVQGRDSVKTKMVGNTNASKDSNSHKTNLSQNDKTVSNKHNTQAEVAKAAGVSTGTVGMAEQVKKREPKLWEKAKQGDVSISAAYKETKKKQRAVEIAEARAEVAEKAATVKPSDRFKIECCDLADYTPPEQVDLIITAPPYPREFLPCFETLARKSNEWLKDGGIAIIMSGQAYLDQVYSMMSKHMDYYWTGCYYTPGQPTPLRHVNVNTTWKPLLIYQKRSDKYKGRIFGDVCKSDGNDKDHHKWGQSISGMDDILNKFALPGQTVLDPFVGAGTTGVSAIKRGCIFYGCELLQENVNISTSRIGDVCND